MFCLYEFEGTALTAIRSNLFLHACYSSWSIFYTFNFHFYFIPMYMFHSFFPFFPYSLTLSTLPWIPSCIIYCTFYHVHVQCQLWPKIRSLARRKCRLHSHADHLAESLLICCLLSVPPSVRVSCQLWEAKGSKCEKCAQEEFSVLQFNHQIKVLKSRFCVRPRQLKILVAFFFQDKVSALLSLR